MAFSASNPTAVRASFKGSAGDELSARLDLPAGPVRGFALFAHCFTCTKDIFAARRIASSLAAAGVGVLRFDFTGLGSSEGEFANTNFSSNVEDLVRAAAYLRDNYSAPALLIGHSLGGAAVLVAAHAIPEARAVVTINAPADAGHVLKNFGSSLEEIRDKGEAQVVLSGRQFRIRSSFVADAEQHRLADRISSLGKALLIMHAPRDSVVDIENASKIFLAAKHPKSFVSLDDADHLLSSPAVAGYAARVIEAWASKYIPEAPTARESETTDVLVHETGLGTYQNSIAIGRHRLIADEPVAAGGRDSGPSPYDYLSIALGACTAMTLRAYANYRNLALGRVSVAIRHGKTPVEHCADCGAVAEGREGKIDRFERVISVEGELDAALRAKLLEISAKCPVHRTLEMGSAVATRVEAGLPPMPHGAPLDAP
ncbi:MAG: bifunctional alpha/beta hydrolase/OsmC family protein [Steroidobacteraceae bacterium]